MRIYPRAGQSWFYLSLILGGVSLFWNAPELHPQTIIEENLPLKNETRGLEDEAAADGEPAGDRTAIENQTAIKAGAAAIVEDQRLRPPKPLFSEPAPKTGAPLPPGRHLTVQEKRLTDGRQVEQNLSGDPRYLGQEVISRPSGRKIYRYYSGQPYRPPEDQASSEQNLNSTVIIEYDSRRPRRPPAKP